MSANFTKAAFSVNGMATATLANGKTYTSQFPLALYKWLNTKDWSDVTVWDDDFNQSYGWTRGYHVNGAF